MRDILLVDLDDTLLDFSKAEKEALEKVLDVYGIENNKINHQKYYEINRSYWKKYELHEIERELLLSKRFEDFFHLFDKEVDGNKVNELYFFYLSQGAYLINNALEFCQKCKDNGYKLIIVSNGVGSVQKPRIEKCGLKKYFDRIYLSEEVGYNKPDIEFFTRVSFDYYQEERMVMIGDSLSSDIQGGKNFNIPTIWYNPNHLKSDLPDFEVDNLMDIFKILEEKL